MFLKSSKQFLIVGSFFYVTFSNCFFDNNLTKVITQKPLNFLGAATLNDVEAPSIKVLGAATGTNIKADAIKVAGSVFFKDVIAHQLDVAGSAKLEEGSINLFNGSGSTTLKKMTITRALIAGACEILFSKIHSIEVKGTASIDNSQIETDCVLFSDATITDTTIGGSIIVEPTYSCDSQENITIGGITINHVRSINVNGGVVRINGQVAPLSSVEQIITLNSATHVKGDITFKSGKGKVYKGREALVTGKIIGAEVFNQ